MIIERKILKSVEVNYESNAFNVCWLNEIVKDDVVISSIPHRCAYDETCRESFIAEVDGAESYLSLVNW